MLKISSMIKIGVIGTGDIAQKAYLPIISRKSVELHLFGRNPETLAQIGSQYGIRNLYNTLDDIIKAGIKAAFVHTSTSSHEEIVSKLLLAGIHVYVDKPVTYDLFSTEKLFSVAAAKQLHLFVGFNRRYAPAYEKLKALEQPNMIIMQKNRKALPADVRTFIFDDFIHVVDTLLYLFPYNIETLHVHGRKEKGLLHHVTIQFISSSGATAIGIMNRDSGTAEEKVEVFTSVDKWVVTNVADTVICRDKNEMKLGSNDWESTLYKRGFEQIIDEFLDIVNGSSQRQDPDVLVTHSICEEIVSRLTTLVQPSAERFPP
jgi:virulence factor